MKDLPNPNTEESEQSLILRIDFSDDVAWNRLCSKIEAVTGEDREYFCFVSDPEYAGLSISEVTSLEQRGDDRSFLFVVDWIALTDEEHPILVLDLAEEPGRTFRVVPEEMVSVENNLSLANMDYADFADSTDADGVFRGFS